MQYRSGIIARLLYTTVVIGFVCGGVILATGDIAAEESVKSNSPPDVEIPIQPGSTSRYMPPKLDPNFRYPNTIPMPLPSLEGKTDPDVPRGKVITKNMATGEITEREGVSLSEILGYEMTTSQESVLRDFVNDPEAPIKTFSNWNLVPDPTTGTYPRSVKLWMRFYDLWDNPVNMGCSGMLIDAMHVLTAGHCIYSHADMAEGRFIYDWADSVTVSPGYQDGVSPWGTADSAYLHTWTGWKEEWDYDYDVAIIDLDRPIGFLTGWNNVGTHPDCEYFIEGQWSHHGYPGDGTIDGVTLVGEFMYDNGGNFDSCAWPVTNGNSVVTESESYHGTSGSGAVRDGTAWAVLSTGGETYTGQVYTKDCTISPGMFTEIANIMSEDRPSSADLWPLHVEAEPLFVMPGQQLSSFSFVLGNYSKQAYNGGVNCYIYLSADDVITSGDMELDYINVQVNLPALGGWHIAIPPPTIPLALASGQYFLGVIIDLADADESNNITGALDQDVIGVTCTHPSAPTITAPPNGEICQPLSRTIDWTDEPDIANYEIQIGAGCGLGTVISTGTISQYTVTGLNNGQTYFVRVRGTKYCGTTGDWSLCNHFTTEYIPSPYFTFTNPAEGEICQDTRSATVRWDPMPRADLYQVQLGETCATGTVYNVNPPLTEHSFSSLLNGTTYYYRARTLDECGNWSDWSLCGEFTTDPDFVAVPHSLFPSDGYPCMSPNVWLSWWPMDGAGGYEVQWGESCESGVIDATPTNLMNLPLLTGGTYFWRVRTVHACGQLSDWSPCRSFTVDAVAPTWPDGLLSSTHTIGTWSNDPLVTTKWIDAVDESCNVEYRVLWDSLPTTVPDELVMHINEIEFTCVPPLTSDDNHWFHVLAKDQPGNLAINPQHLGPFWIDVTPPVNPAVTTLTPEYVWVAPDSLIMHWDGASDIHSGLAGYAVLFDQIDVVTPPTTPVINGQRAAWMPDNHGVWWFHLMTADAAGNWSFPVHKGPYLVDMLPPDVLLQYPIGSVVFVQSTIETIDWLADDHAQSGLASIALDYSTNGGSSWYHITTLTDPADLALDTYDWHVPYASTDSAVVRVTVTDKAGNWASNQNERFFSMQAVSGVDSPETPALPTDFVLAGNVPNPFNPMTTIRYGVPRSTRVNLCVYNLQGRRVKTLVNTVQSGPAWYEVIWKGQNNNGQIMAAGVYLFRLEAGDYVETKRMVLIK